MDYDVTRKFVTGAGMVNLPARPLMHGTGCMTQLIACPVGGCVVTLIVRHLDIEERFDTVERQGQTPPPSWATRSPSRCSGRSKPTRVGGTS